MMASEFITVPMMDTAFTPLKRIGASVVVVLGAAAAVVVFGAAAVVVVLDASGGVPLVKAY